MSVKVLLPNAFQKHTNNVREIASTAANLPELVKEILATAEAFVQERGASA